MTEESVLHQINLIEYEEFVQTETTNPNIQETNNQLGDIVDDGELGEDLTGKMILDKKDSKEYNVNLTKNKNLLSSEDKIPFEDISQISPEIHQNVKGELLNNNSNESLAQEDQKKNSYNLQGSVGISPQSSRKGTREVIFQEKIIHMQNIINAQKEQMQQKDDKINFLLNQIQELNQQMQNKTNEVSSVRENLSKVQQEIELMKQQQRIKEEIQNKQSQILEIQIEKEEQIIENLNKQLIVSRNNSQDLTYEKKENDNLDRSNCNNNLTELKTVKNNKKQIEKLLNSAATTTLYNSQTGNSLSATTQKNNQKNRDIMIKNPWNNQSQITSNQQLSRENATVDTTNYFSQNIQPSPSPVNVQNNDPQIENTESISNLIQSIQLKNNNFQHKKNTMSTDFVYKREPLIQRQFQNIQQSNQGSNILDTQLAKTPYQNNSSNGIPIVINKNPINQNIYRSNSNHTSTLTTNNISSNKIYPNNENRVKEFYEKSNSQPPNQTSAGKGSATAQDLTKKTESYRQQYIKNIEELQKRLDFLKQKRTEYEIKPQQDLQNTSQSSRLASNLQRIHQDNKIINSSISTPTQTQFFSQKLHQSQNSLQSPNNNSMISNSINQKINENMLLHFSQIKKIENLNNGKDSYFNKQLFCPSNQTQVNGNTLKQDENLASKYASNHLPSQIKYDNYVSNDNLNTGNNTIPLKIDPQVDQLQDLKQNNMISPHHIRNGVFGNSIPETALIHSKQMFSKQYFPVSSKQKLNNNEYSLQNTPYIMQERTDSVSPTKPYSTRNSQNNYQSLADNLALSASLKKDIKNHKISWDSLNLKDPLISSNLPTRVLNGGTGISHYKNSGISAFNKLAPISVKNSFQFQENDKNQFSSNSNNNKYFSSVQEPPNQVYNDQKNYNLKGNQLSGVINNQF